MPPVQPTGRVVRDDAGLQLLLERRLPATAAEAWDWITSPARLRKWIGTYRGTPAVGDRVDFTMTAEKGASAEPALITRCDPGSRLALELGAGGETWVVAVSLAEIGDATVIYFSQRLDDWRQAGIVGPGWEYYLDRLLAAHGGRPMPDFDEYFTPQRPYYERLALDGEPLAAQTETGR